MQVLNATNEPDDLLLVHDHFPLDFKTARVESVRRDPNLKASVENWRGEKEFIRARLLCLGKDLIGFPVCPKTPPVDQLGPESHWYLPNRVEMGDPQMAPSA
jgi:hypothetical protein